MTEDYTFGELVQFCRKVQKVSQCDLCRGLCSVSTLTLKLQEVGKEGRYFQSHTTEILWRYLPGSY